MKIINNMNTRESFGLTLTKSREFKKLSIEEVAIRAGIEPNTLIRIEKGKFNPGLDILLKIAEALDMELGFIEAN